MIKKCQESKGYGSIRKGIHGAVGVLALGLLFSTTAVVYADEVSEHTPTTASSEQVINTSETLKLTAENDVATSTGIVGNEGASEVETTTGTNSPTVGAVPSTGVEASNVSEESISTTPETNTNLEAKILSTSASATDRAAEVLEDRTAPKLVSYTLDKPEYQAGETVTLTIDSEDESNLFNVSSKLISSDGTQSLYFSSSNFEKLANGLYRSVLTGSIPENRPSDIYYIEYINLGDEIGNNVIYYDSSKNTWAEHTFAPLSMTVTGTVTDRTAPKLVSYTLDKTEYQAGETVTLTIDSEDESNLSYVSSKLISSDGTQSLYFSSSNFEKLANGLYRSVLTGSIPENRPSDIYYIEYINLGDEIGNNVIYYDSSKNTWAEHTFAPLSMTVNSVTSGSVLIHYQLEDGTTIAEDKRISGVVSELAFGSEEPVAKGITYDTSDEAPLLLNGMDGRQYYKVKVDGVEQGLLKAGLTEITYTYTPYLVSTEQVEKKTGKVIVQYQTRTGQTLKESVEAVPETLISYREKTIYADGSESLSEPIQNYPTFYVYDYQVQTIEQNGKIYRLSYENQPSLYGELVEGDTVLTLQYIPIPKLESLTFDKESHQPGDKLTASFVVSSEEEMESIFFGLSDKKLTSQYVLRGESNNPIKLVDGLYRFDVTVPIASDYPRSDLSLDFVYLNAKNESSSNSLSEPEIIQNITSQAIINSPNIVTDFTAPKFIELETSRNEAKQGETVEVVLLVEDDSNIASVNLGFESESGTLRFGENITNIEQLEGNKKRITLSETIHYSYSPGQYELKYLYLTDIYGNTSYLSTVDSLPAKTIVVNQANDVENLNPVVETTIVTNIEVVEKSSGRVLIRTNFHGEDLEAMKQVIREAISAYENEHGVTFDLLGAGGSQISSRSVTVGNRTQTEVIRSYQQLVVNTSDTPLPEIEKRLLPVGVIYDNSTIRQALYTIQFKDGESTVKESRRVANSTIDSIIRDESNGIDEKAYYFESVEVSQGFTTIFSSDLNYNGPFYEIIVNLKSNSKVDNSGSITPPIEVVPPATEPPTSPTEVELPIVETPVTPTEESTPVDETPVTPTEERTPVDETPDLPAEENSPVDEIPVTPAEENSPVDETPVTPTKESTPVDETPVTPAEESIPVDETPASSTEENSRVEETSAPPTEVVPSVTENSSIPTKVDKLVIEVSPQLTMGNTNKEDLSSATTVTGQKVETKKTSAPTLPRTNGHQSNLPILAGLALLSLTVAKRKKDFLG
ncbi:TPA: LPXTG cell wall anchor domain-containing protein [Streptococcus suis]